MLSYKKYSIEEYVSVNGTNHFRTWFNSIKDIKTRARIQARLLRVELGNLGDCKFLGEGVMELRLDFASGYRIYFGNDKGTIIILLAEGDKSSQRKDIINARQLWKEYREVK
jgi:putative addiction module killer protein